MSKTLLLADDSVTIQKVVGISFANEDVVLVTVDNGDDAIAKAREVRPDIVLADVVMPGKTGYDVCQTIKEDPQLAHIPVLLLTGTFEAFDEARASAAGADGHITKPFEAQALVDTVNARLAAAPPVAAAAPAAPAVASSEPFDFLESDAAPLDDLSGSGESAAPMIMGNDLGSSDQAFSFDQAESGLSSEEVPDLVPADGAAPRASSTGGGLFEAPDAEDDNARTKLVMSAEDELANATTLPPREADDASISGLGASATPEPVPPTAEPAPSLEADAGDFGADLDLGATDPDSSQPFADHFDASAGVDPLADTEGEANVVFDPTGARDFDVASADLSEPAETPALTREPSAPQAAPIALPQPTASTTREPIALAPEPVAEPEVEIEDLDVPTLEPAAAALPDANEMSDPGPFARPMAAETDIADEPILEAENELEPIELHEPVDDVLDDAPAPPAEPALEVETLAESLMHDTPPPPAASERPAPDLSPLMREQLHEALEKVAWETFGDVAERIVQDALARVEEVAWEVIPKMAEALIQEEIRKMKGGGDD